MKKLTILLAAFFLLASCNPSAMKLTSTAFENGGSLPAAYTCDGNNVNPPLQFTELPSETQSLALIMDDPDAPSGTWNHWLVWNINPNNQQIAENSLINEATEGTNDFGNTGYGGACPPTGTHRNFFRLYALDTKLTLTMDAKRDELDRAMEGHVLAEAELMATYQRP
jgi:Raf kinase inhibitor-like YbhB/YbcL family protein